MTPLSQNRRIAFVWFPDLTLERWSRIVSQERTLPDNDVAVALSRDGAQGPVIHCCNPAARDRGLRPGERVVDAQAIHPDLHVEAADLPGDRMLMQRLVHWSRRWCPWTVQDGADGLVLDVTGSAHLFGGEPALLRDIRRRFALQGLTVRLALAPTRGAAQALARYGPDGTICASGEMAARLASLPVAALGVDPATQKLLVRLGLKTVGALAEIPRIGLMRRFATLEAGRNPLVLLDRALGQAPDPLNAPPDETRYEARVALAEPVMDPYPHLEPLTKDLCRTLFAEEQGVRQMRLTIFRIDSECRRFDVALAQASRDPAHLRRLFDDRLDSLDPGFGFDLLTLEANRVEPLSQMQGRFDGETAPERDIAGLVDRLSARLGRERVTWAIWRESHKPERVEGRIPALVGTPSPAPTLLRDRPIRILSSPEEVAVIYAVPDGPPSQFRWRRAVYQTVRHTGPERVSPEWWHDRPGTRLRDYYKVEVEDGRRFWLYREGLLGDGRGGDPRWFLHGFFA